MGRRWTVKIKPQIYSGMLLMMFFCDDVFASVVEEIFGSSFVTPLYYLIFFVLLSLTIIVKKNKGSLIVPFWMYFFVFLLLLFTTLIHPEYDKWFSHSVYGIVPAFLSPRAGIWAFLIVWLVNDDDLYTSVKYTAFILFLFGSLQFALVSVRGYWIIKDIEGTLRHDRYSLEYGYDMLLPVAFFGAEWLLQSKKLYFVPYIFGAFMIFSSGSRGAVIWTVIMFLMILPFKWKNIESKKKIWLVLFLTVLSIAVVLICMNYQVILSWISSIFTRYGISSRTLLFLMEGSFSDGNGREQIYALAIDLIKTGGLFGHGVYGDRYTIGNYFKWGYSHNIFLEFFVSFGYIGGAVASLSLIIGIFRLYRHCDTLKRQIVFITFLIPSCKLILSNSFWYTSGFWALLALMMKWNRGYRLRICKGTKNMGSQKGKARFVKGNVYGNIMPFKGR